MYLCVYTCTQTLLAKQCSSLAELRDLTSEIAVSYLINIRDFIPIRLECYVQANVRLKVSQ